MRWIAVVVPCLACAAQDSGLDGADDGSSTGTTAQSSDGEGDSSGPTSETSGSTTTGSIDVDPCAASEPPNCAPGCVVTEAWSVVDGGCAANPIGICAPEAATDPEPKVVWIEGPDGPLFLEVGTACGAGADAPLGWSECRGIDGDPPECDCFCTQSWCPAEADRFALEACDLGEPCPTVAVSFLDPEVNERAEICVFEALRDRVPGVYAWSGSAGFGGSYQRFYVDESGVQTVSGGAGDVISCPTAPAWGAASRCDLAASDYFASCLELVGTEQDCAFTPEDWIVGCEAQPASCGE